MKHKQFIGLLSVILIMISFLGCATTRFVPANDYVAFYSDEAIKSSEQSIAGFSQNYELLPSYEDQFFYDSEGNLIRTIQTEYLEFEGETPQFVEWDVSYAKIGDQIVPKSIAANGIVFLEVDYEIFTVEQEGILLLETETPKVVINRIDPWSGTINQLWTMGLEAYPVSFRIDDKFVIEEEIFSPLSGYFNNRVLSYGYNNIAITRFFFSYEKLSEGINDSFIKYNPNTASMVAALQDSEVEFFINWDVTADKLVQTRLEVIGSIQANKIHFLAEREFNSAGQRTYEVWNVQDQELIETEGFLTIFEQRLTY
jgi:hypothetical protein